MARTSEYVVLVPYTYRLFGWTQKEDGLFQFVSSLSKLMALILFLPWAKQQFERQETEVLIEPEVPLSPNRLAGSEMEEQVSLLSIDPSNRISYGTIGLETLVIHVSYILYAVTFFLFALAWNGCIFLAGKVLFHFNKRLIADFFFRFYRAIPIH